MTLADLMPVRIGLLDRAHRPARKHRAPDECERLRFLLFGANLCIRGLRLQLDDQDRKHAEIIARIDERHGEVVRGLEAELAEARQRITIASQAETAVTKTQELSLDEIRQHCVMPLHQSPMAVTNPGRVPSWVKQDEEGV